MKYWVSALSCEVEVSTDDFYAELYELLEWFINTYELRATEEIISHNYNENNSNLKPIEDMSIKDLITSLNSEINYSENVNPVITITNDDKECIFWILNDGRIFLRGKLIGTDKELAEIIDKIMCKYQYAKNSGLL